MPLIIVLPEQTKVVILGQDPYHGPGQGTRTLFFRPGRYRATTFITKNIFKEINNDLGKPVPTSGNLERWAEQECTITQRYIDRESPSGWFTSEQRLGNLHRCRHQNHFPRKRKPRFLFLWGSYAQRKGAFINTQRHLVLKSVHPSPLSANNGLVRQSPIQSGKCLAPGNLAAKEIEW